MMARQRTAEVSCSAERINEPSTLFTLKDSDPREPYKTVIPLNIMLAY